MVDEVDVAAHPERYRVGRGEQGVFHVQPHKDRLLAVWTVRDLDGAREGAEAIEAAFREARDADDLPAMDMARKYLQMGMTRALRYARYPGGTKHDPDGTPREPVEWVDQDKAAIADLYRAAWDRVREDPAYVAARDAWRDRYG